MIRGFIIFALVAVLAGCGQVLRKAGPTPEEAAGDKRPLVLPFEEPAVDHAVSLSPDIIYSILLADLAAQRKDFATAYVYYLQGADLAGDPQAAARATRIGVFLKDAERALAAAERWVALEPNELSARMAAAALYIKTEQADSALEQLKAVVAIGQALGLNGFSKAVEAIGRAENPALGLDLMRRLLAEYPNDPQAHYALALTALAVKKYDEAEAEIRRVLKASPDQPQGWVLLSNILRSQGKDDEAQHALEQALEAMSDDRLLLTAYARLLMEGKAYEQAYRQFHKLNSLAPGDSDVLYALGILALELEHWSKARGYLQQVIATGKQAGEATYFIGRSYELEGDDDEAMRWYEQVPQGKYHVESQIGMATLLARRSEVGRVRDIFRRLRQGAPARTVGLYLIEGEVLRDAELCEEALNLFAEALEANPGNSELLYARALCAANLGRIDILEDDLRVVLNQTPDHANALNALGYTLADQTDRYEEALGYIQRALSLMPASAAVLDSMGWVQYRLGNHEEALRYLRRAMELMPDPEIAAHLGEVLWVTGERDQARKVWQDALSTEPQHKLLRNVMERFELAE